MSNGTPRETKVVGNLGILDLRNTADESVSSISVVGNLGTVLYSRETAHLLARIDPVVGNMGKTIEAPRHARVHTGELRISGGFLKGQAAPIDLVVAGRVVVDPDTLQEDIEGGLGQLVITGNLVCPEHVLGAVQSKILHLGGRSIEYPTGARVVLDRLSLDEPFLQSMDDGTVLVVAGNLSVRTVVENELLGRKIERLRVTGKILAHAENAAVLFARMSGAPIGGTTTLVPAGHALIERAMVIDNPALQSLSHPRLYCTQAVHVDPDTDPALLDARLESLVCKDTVYCPEALGEVVHRKCDLSETQVLTYEGTLWQIADVRDLIGSAFEFTEGKVTIVVTGVLKIAPDIEPAVLADRLAKVHNKGVIKCTPEQMGAIQARIGMSYGVLAAAAMVEDDDKEVESGIVGNAGYLAL